MVEDGLHTNKLLFLSLSVFLNNFSQGLKTISTFIKNCTLQPFSNTDCIFGRNRA